MDLFASRRDGVIEKIMGFWFFLWGGKVDVEIWRCGDVGMYFVGGFVIEEGRRRRRGRRRGRRGMGMRREGGGGEEEWFGGMVSWLTSWLGYGKKGLYRFFKMVGISYSLGRDWVGFFGD